MAELKALIDARGQIKSKITRLRTFFNTHSDKQHLDELKIRYRHFQDVLKEFEKIQNKIEVLDNSEQQESYREEVEQQFFKLSSEIEVKLAESNNDNENNSDRLVNFANTNTNSNNISVHLPIINLPNFTGQYDEWVSFIDTFDSLIHENNKLSHVQKFHYLRSCLKGDAATAIEPLTASQSNYAIARDLLRSRYENKRLIVKTHVSAIFNIQPIIKISAVSLRSLLDTINLHLEQLKNLKLPVSEWDVLLVHVITSKFDYVTLREWELTLNSEIPSLDSLKSFISNRCQVLEALAHNNKSNQASSNQTKIIKQKTRITTCKATVNDTKINTCPVCKQVHYINQCNKFLALSAKDKLVEVKKLHLCTNCLRQYHSVTQCRSVNTCKYCNKKHHSLLHNNEQPQHNDVSHPSTSQLASENQANTINAHSAIDSKKQYSDQVLLSTAIVHVFDKYGQPHDCRILLDSGSQSNFMTGKMYSYLQLPYKKVAVPISGINSANTNANKLIDVKIKSRINNFAKTITCLILPKITENIPGKTFNSKLLNIPSNIQLADNNFNVSSQIDMLLGAEHFWDFLCVGQIKLGNHKPHLQKTVLGWIVGGAARGNSQQLRVQTYLAVESDTLKSQVEKFWEIEHYNSDNNKYFSKDDNTCEAHFLNTHKRDIEGRFITELPLNENISRLGESKEIALKRFISLEAKFKNNLGLKQQYKAFLDEYIKLGHMQEITSQNESDIEYFMPHRAVISDTSLTTKLRVVFDASCKTTTGFSLNDSLLTGPKIQKDLCDIIINFRTYQVAFAADISKMYRQIWSHPKHYKFQQNMNTKDCFIQEQS